jgi:hypothetical protein
MILSAMAECAFQARIACEGCKRLWAAYSRAVNEDLRAKTAQSKQRRDAAREEIRSHEREQHAG